MLAATYEGRTWYRPQSVSAVIYQDLTAVRCLPHDDQWCHVDGKIWCEIVVAAPNSAKLKIWSIKITDKNHLLVTILASCLGKAA